MKRGSCSLVFVVLCMSLISSVSYATLWTIDFVPFNETGDLIPIAGVDVSMEISGFVIDDVDYVRFDIINNSTISADVAVEGVYFDDGALEELTGVIDRDNTGHPGVGFSQIADPPDLPGGETLPDPFITTLDFSADADPPPSHLGVNFGEWLGLEFRLASGMTAQNVIDDLVLQNLRVGIHVVAMPDSVSAINGPPTIVPEPATICLLGLGGLALLKKRRV